MRLIDPNALVKHIKDLPTWWADDGGVYPGGSMKYPDGMYYPEDIISSIDNAPTVDAVEVVHGHKVVKERHRGVARYIPCPCCGSAIPSNKPYMEKVEYCSVCGKKLDDTFQNYCPNCGAKMDGGNEDGKEG